MAGRIGGVALVKIRARSVLGAGNIHNGGIRDGLAVGVNNLSRNTRPVCPYYYVQVGLGQNWETGIGHIAARSEEHTSELQSHLNLVCRLLLEKKKQHHILTISSNSNGV